MRRYCTRVAVNTKYASHKERWPGSPQKVSSIELEPEQTTLLKEGMRQIFDDYYEEASSASMISQLETQIECSRQHPQGALQEVLAAETLLQSILVTSGGRKGGVDMTVRKGLLGDWEVPFEGISLRCWSDLFYPFTFKRVSAEVVSEAIALQKKISTAKLRGSRHHLPEANLAVLCVITSFEMQVHGQSDYLGTLFNLISSLTNGQVTIHPNIIELAVSSLCKVADILRMSREQEQDHKKKTNIVMQEINCSARLCNIIDALSSSASKSWGPHMFPSLYFTARESLDTSKLANFLFSGKRLLPTAEVIIDYINFLYDDFQHTRSSEHTLFCKHAGTETRKVVSTLLYHKIDLLKCDQWKTEEGIAAAGRLLLLLTGASGNSDDKISWSVALSCITHFHGTANELSNRSVSVFLSQINTTLKRVHDPLASELVLFIDFACDMQNFPFASESYWLPLLQLAYKADEVTAGCSDKVSKLLISNIEAMVATDPVRFDPLLSQLSIVNTFLRAVKQPSVMCEILTFMEKRRLQLSQHDYFLTFNVLIKESIHIDTIINKLWLGPIGANNRLGSIRNSFIICAAQAYCIRYHCDRRRPDQQTAARLIEDHLSDWLDETRSLESTALRPHTLLSSAMLIFKKVLPPPTYSKLQAALSTLR